jgi:hypothetical protein
MKKVNSIIGRLEASLNGSLDGLELDNMDDVIEKSLVIDMVKDLKMLVDEAKQEVKNLNILAVSGALPSDATVKLLQTIIGWEKDVSEYMSLETKLRELFIISERQ